MYICDETKSSIYFLNNFSEKTNIHTIRMTKISSTQPYPLGQRICLVINLLLLGYGYLGKTDSGLLYVNVCEAYIVAYAVFDRFAHPLRPK
jgi:hypothetical protein